MVLLCKRSHVQFKVKTQNPEWKRVSFGSRSILWEIMWTQLVAINYSPSLQENWALSVAAHKPVIIARPTSSSTACRQGSVTQKPCLLGALGFSSKGDPILTFPVASRANHLYSVRADVMFGWRIRGKVRVGLRCISPDCLIPGPWSFW